jgi:hypothetical protein
LHPFHRRNPAGRRPQAKHKPRKKRRRPPPFPHCVGEKDTRIDTNITPKRISSSGHHRSNQDTDSLDELISTFSSSTSKS